MSANIASAPDHGRPLVLIGTDNKRKPRQAFANDLFVLSDDEFVKQAETIIWLSAYADNNSRSDYHWQADACYSEAARRKRPDLYELAWKRASDSVS